MIKAAALIQRLAARSGDVPDGWQLVPKVAPWSMIELGMDYAVQVGGAINSTEIQGVWAAMLAAAPSAEVER